MVTLDDNDGETLLLGSAHSATPVAGIHGPWAGSPVAQRHMVPLQAAPLLSLRTRIGVVTCSQRNHGDAQQQAAFAALRARAQTVPPSHDMDPEHEALWGHRLSDIHTISPRCFGACTVKPPTAPHTSEQKSSPRRAGASMIGYDNTPRKKTNGYTLGCEGIRPPRWNSRSTATQPLTPHSSWLPSVVSGLISGHWWKVVTTTFAPFSRCFEQSKNKTHCLTSTTAMLDTALRASRRRAGKGHNMLGPADILALPDQGRRDLCELLNHVEPACTWPWQLLSTSIMLKPKPDNTDRPLGLLPMMVRIWEKIRQPPMQAWCRERAGPWDQAVERSAARSSNAPWRRQRPNTGWTQPFPWSIWRSSTTRYASITS